MWDVQKTRMEESSVNKYPTADELTAMGERLQKDVNFCSASLLRWFGRAQSSPIYTRSEDKKGSARPHHKLGGRRIA